MNTPARIALMLVVCFSSTACFIGGVVLLLRAMTVLGITSKVMSEHQFWVFILAFGSWATLAIVMPIVVAVVLIDLFDINK